MRKVENNWGKSLISVSGSHMNIPSSTHTHCHRNMYAHMHKHMYTQYAHTHKHVYMHTHIHVFRKSVQLEIFRRVTRDSKQNQQQTITLTPDRCDAAHLQSQHLGRWGRRITTVGGQPGERGKFKSCRVKLCFKVKNQDHLSGAVIKALAN